MGKKKGYDPDLIKSGAGPTDVKWINQLGWCYRAPLESSSSSDSRGWRNEDEWKLPGGGDGDQDAPKKSRSESPRTTKARIEQEKKLDVLRKKEVDRLQKTLVMPLANEMPTLPQAMVHCARHYLNQFTAAQDEINKAKTAEEIAALTAVTNLLAIFFANIR